MFEKPESDFFMDFLYELKPIIENESKYGLHGRTRGEKLVYNKKMLYHIYESNI